VESTKATREIARVIADQVRARDDLRPVTPLSDADAGLALLGARQHELVVDRASTESRYARDST
jgi:hypothetical protein